MVTSLLFVLCVRMYGSKSGVKGLCRFFWEMESEEAKGKKEEAKRQTEKMRKRWKQGKSRHGGGGGRQSRSDEVQGRGKERREGGSRVSDRCSELGQTEKCRGTERAAHPLSS